MACSSCNKTKPVVNITTANIVKSIKSTPTIVKVVLNK